jgi:mannose-6-phosphate isomerase
VKDPRIEERENAIVTTFVESEFFTVYKWEMKGKATFSFNDRYLLLSVSKGHGQLLYGEERYEMKKGSHLILPVGFGEFEIDGECELIVSHT